MKPRDKIKNRSPSDSRLSAFLGVILFAGLMTALLLIIRAAGPYVALEAEDAIGTGTVVKSDTNASDGEYIEFVEVSTPPPPPPPSGTCTGVNVTAGSNLVNIANAQAAGTTFCLAAGTYSLTASIPVQNGDKWIGALGASGERLSILTGNNTTTYLVTATSSDVLFRNFIIERFNNDLQQGINSGSQTNWDWDYLEVRENKAHGIHTHNGSSVTNSYIHHNHQMGLGGGGDNVLIEGNEIAWNNYLGESMPGWEGGGSKWVHAENLTVRGNYAHHNCGNGLWVDGTGNINYLFEDNTSTDNWAAGIFAELANGPGIIRNNYVARNTFGNVGVICQNTTGGESTGAGNGGIRANAAKDIEIYGNTIVDNDGGYSSDDDSRSPDVTNISFHDNDVTWSVGFVGIQDTATGSGEPFTSGANNHFENNDYHYNGTSSAPFRWAGADRSWTTWKTYGHDETGSFD